LRYSFLPLPLSNTVAALQGGNPSVQQTNRVGRQSKTCYYNAEGKPASAATLNFVELKKCSHHWTGFGKFSTFVPHRNIQFQAHTSLNVYSQMYNS